MRGFLCSVCCVRNQGKADLIKHHHGRAFQRRTDNEGQHRYKEDQNRSCKKIAVLHLINSGKSNIISRNSGGKNEHNKGNNRG